ncbi:MAG: redoxin domain-containing protein [Bacteroidales bacterium]|nr:redoxin domain-containing protein [Bacteroidales bacterium]
MKQHFLFVLCLLIVAACGNKNAQTKQHVETQSVVKKPIVESLSEQQYREVVFNYLESPTQWDFKGGKPCVVDFYAEWCRPCKAIAPYFDTLAEVYAEKVDFYKINVDYARELSEFFQIRSIPTVMFCDEESLQYANGAYTMDFYVKMIDSLLLHKF